MTATDQRIHITRPPMTPDELHAFCQVMWGITIPRLRVCPDHVSPFDAFCEGYFGNPARWVLWYGSRGTGKSLMLALLALTKAAALEINVTLLGGSMAQSNNIHEHVENLLTAPNAPRYAIDSQIKTQLLFTAGNWVRPLPASQKTVRGPHPHLTLLDEIDEMERPIYDAAMGQAMRKPNMRGEIVSEMTVASSTWQNPQGCMYLGTAITTSRGEVPIEQVVVGDQVMTRHGWRSVTGSWDMGYQPTVTVNFASGRQIICTPWHPVWTSQGWVRANSLSVGLHVSATPLTLPPALASRTLAHDATQAFSLDAVRPHDAMGSQVVTVPTDRSFRSYSEGSSVVGSVGNDLQVSGVDARPGTTQVVDHQSFGDWTVDLDPDPAMCRYDSGSHRSVGLGPIAVLHDVERPQDAVVSVEAHSVAFAQDEVVSVSHVPIVLPTWDLTVDGTHEYVANGILVHNTFQQVRDEAMLKGLAVRTWCWKETLRTPENPGGWMDPEFIEAKRSSVPAEMFRVEFDLGEPAGDARAFDLAKLDQACREMVPVDETHKGNDDIWVYEKPIATCTYAAGADWAKERDMTVICVVRTDITPHPVVYLRRMNRKPWPEMIEAFNKVTSDYQAVSSHDGTGIGNVVADLIDERTNKVVMVGRDRVLLLTEYVAAVENSQYVLPRNTPLHLAHKAATVDDLYSTDQSSRSHLPDDVAAMAICHRAVTRQAPPVSPGAVPQGTYEPKLFAPLRPEPDAPFYESTKEGVVHIKDDAETTVFWL